MANDPQEQLHGALVSGTPNKKMLTVEDAAKRLRVHPATVKRRITAGKLRSIEGPAGEVFLDADEVDELAQTATPEDSISNILQASAGIIRAQMDHNETVLDLSAKSAFELLKLYGDEAKAKRERISELEKKLEEQRATLEKAQADLHTREMDRLEFVAKQARMKEALDTVRGFAPLAHFAMAKKIGARSATVNLAEEGMLVQFIRDFTEEEVTKICEALGGIKGHMVLGLWQKFQEAAADEKKKADEEAAKVTTNGAAA